MNDKIIIRKVQNENEVRSHRQKSPPKTTNLSFAKRTYTHLLLTSYQKTEFTCGCIPEIALKRARSSRWLERSPYHQSWQREHEQLARIFLEVLKKVSVECYNLNNLENYSELYLQVYLMRACWLAANHFAKKGLGRLNSLQRNYEFFDYLQIAWEGLCNQQKLFSNLSFADSIKVENYAIPKLITKIRDRIVQENSELKKTQYKEYGLLRNISKNPDKELIPALNFLGINSREIEKMVLVWRCFLNIYRPPSHKQGKRLPPPTAQDCENIAILCNERRSNSQQPITEETVIPCLEKCIEALSQWLSSIRFSYPDANMEWDNLVTKSELNSRDRIPEEICNTVRDILAQSFAALTPYQQGILLTLKSGLQANQNELAGYLGVNQATIARHRRKSLKELFTGFIRRWNINNPERQCNDPENSLIQYFVSGKSSDRTTNQERSLAVFREELLTQLEEICFFKIHSCFQEYLDSLNASDREILQQENKDDREKWQQSFCDRFLHRLGNDLEKSPEFLAPLSDRVEPLFIQWLEFFAIFN